MLTITKYQQSSLLIQSGDQVLAVDIGSMVTPESLAEIGQPTMALVSHIHRDHFFEPHLVAMGAPVHTVNEVVQAVEDSKALTVISQKVGDTITLANTPFEVTFLPSDHGPNAGPVEQAAFLIRSEGKAIYFLADMYNGAPFPEGAIDAVLIPIGGRGYTFDPEMAVAHLKKIGWTGLTIPIHYDINPPALEVFVNLAQGVAKVHTLVTGETFEL